LKIDVLHRAIHFPHLKGAANKKRPTEFTSVGRFPQKD
jgi:hypothetical protein